MTTAASPQAAPEKTPLTEEQIREQIAATARLIVREDVQANVGDFMDYCISRAFEGDEKNPFSEDEIDFRVDPSEWDAEQCNAYLAEYFDKTWRDVTGEEWEIGQRDDRLEEARGRIAAWSGEADDYDENDNPLPNEREEAIAKYYDKDLDLWDASLLHGFITEEMDENWKEITGLGFEDTVTDADDEDDYEDELETVRDYIRDNADPREPYEWWIVTGWLARKLADHGAIILDSGYNKIWGRETTGQVIYMDGIIGEIAEELCKARGEI